MTGRDGGLAAIFKTRLPFGDWQSVETWSTGQGVPDLNYCLDGREGWVELKAAAARAVVISPEQVAWAERRSRRGGRVFLAVRRQTVAGVRKGPAVDELWICKGVHVRLVLQDGLDPASSIFDRWSGGPAKWDWGSIERVLMR